MLKKINTEWIFFKNITDKQLSNYTTENNKDEVFLEIESGKQNNKRQTLITFKLTYH